MAESIFTDLEAKAYRQGIQPRTKESLKWFRGQLANMKQINRWKLLKDERLHQVSRPRVGEMFMFWYDAKTKDKLPYYDQFPLILMVDRAPKGFYGLNLHYLPLTLRARLFDELRATVNNTTYTENTRMALAYNLLKSTQKLKYFKPCFKRYLTSQVESGIVKVQPTEWEVALFMPTQKFKGATATNVWNDSRRSV